MAGQYVYGNAYFISTLEYYQLMHLQDQIKEQAFEQAKEIDQGSFLELYLQEKQCNYQFGFEVHGQERSIEYLYCLRKGEGV